MASGLIFNLQRYALNDGPGIRTTVFLKGCPLQCLWCHNPEGISAAPVVATYENRCVSCGECIAACPKALPRSSSDHGPLCDRCGICIEACPTGARHAVGQEMTVESLLEELRKDRVFFDDSQGGVTFSGGEPMSQPAFLRAMLTACRAEGMHTAVDTSGFCPQSELLSVAPLADLFLFDIKAYDRKVHLRCAGAGNEMILENLRALCAVHQNIWIRLPLVPSLNDDPHMLEDTARFLRRLPGITLVNLLPYHKTGMAKFRRLGQAYLLPDIKGPTPSELELLAAPFRKLNLPVKIGG